MGEKDSMDHLLAQWKQAGDFDHFRHHASEGMQIVGYEVGNDLENCPCIVRFLEHPICQYPPPQFVKRSQLGSRSGGAPGYVSIGQPGYNDDCWGDDD